MRKTILALALVTSLGGCAQLQAIQGGISIATASITNPVTKTKEAEIEIALDAAINALQAYKSACSAGSADKNCKANVAAVQVYTRQAKPMIIQLRSFVDNNDQVNAVVVYNQLNTLYANIKQAASNIGVKLGS